MATPREAAPLPEYLDRPMTDWSTEDWRTALTDLARREHARFEGAVISQGATLSDGTVLVWNADADQMERITTEEEDA